MRSRQKHTDSKYETLYEESIKKAITNKLKASTKSTKKTFIKWYGQRF